MYLKEQVDVLRGRNEEIRSELRETRVEINKLLLERDKAFEKVTMNSHDDLNVKWMRNASYHHIELFVTGDFYVMAKVDTYQEQVMLCDGEWQGLWCLQIEM